MPKLHSSRWIAKVLERKGFIFISQKGSHMKFRKVGNPTLTVILPAGREIPYGTFRDPLKNMISSRNLHTLSEKRELATKAYQHARSEAECVFSFKKNRKDTRSARVWQPKCANCSSKHVFQRVLRSILRQSKLSEEDFRTS